VRACVRVCCVLLQEEGPEEFKDLPLLPLPPSLREQAASKS
jgi:hypothetical protein